MWFLALCVVWTLGVIAWAAVALLTPAGDSPEEAVERKAGMHHDQQQSAGRYYIPTYAKTEKDGTAVLRYEVGSSQDSGVKDFLRTYGITAEAKGTSTSKVRYSDRFGDVRRTFTITYHPSPEPGGYDHARITVRARRTDAS
ncbi:hypothetical protein [Streptomyces altiplanensis]